jgi:hypothetical protein
MRKLLIWLRLPLFLIAAAVFFINERYFGSEALFASLRFGLLGVMALSLLGTGLLAFGVKGQAKGEQTSFRWALLWQIAFMVGLGVYSAYGAALKGAPDPETLPQKALLIVWLLLIFLSSLSGLGIEWAIKNSGLDETAEPRRVAKAGTSMLGIGLFLGALVGFNYTAAQRNISRDWSYLKIRTPSESSLKMVAALTEPLTIALYYPQTNEVLSLVQEYFTALKSKQPLIKLEFYDKDMNPLKAEAHRIQRNGQIFLEFKERKSTIETGLTLAKARKNLKSIDKEFQKSFLEITTSRKTIYFTRGHGEMTWLSEGTDNPFRSLKAIEGYLRTQNYSTRFLGVSEGFTTGVPDDAAVVVIAGPTEPFLKEEIDSLNGFVEKGGKVMAFLDIQGPTGELVNIADKKPNPLYEWLSQAGLSYVQTPLANDKNFVPMSRSDADHWFIFSNIFTSHESVINLARNDERLAILMYASGYLTVTPEKGKWKTYETVRSVTDTFNDENRNFKIDGEEKRDSYIIGAIAETKAPVKGEGGKNNDYGRIVVFSDASFISDLVATNSQGNAIFFADSLKWLVGDVQISGQVAEEEDVKIRHTNKEETTWFYGTVVVVPLLVLGAGLIATRRRTVKVKEIVHAG